jgi:hypothetical protein
MLLQKWDKEFDSSASEYGEVKVFFGTSCTDNLDLFLINASIYITC